MTNLEKLFFVKDDGGILKNQMSTFTYIFATPIQT